jgi:crotonobetainyl-CoA:carnitine CoA-transferase CaiB-like acyl-CoA transferase
MEFKDYDFNQWDTSTLSQEENDRILGIVGDFIKTKTKAELYEEAVKRGIMLAPCNTTEDISTSAQLEAREFWEKVEHPELGETIVYPGAPLKIDKTPWRIQRRAPLIGEHNQEVYAKELALSAEQITRLKENNII